MLHLELLEAPRRQDQGQQTAYETPQWRDADLNGDPEREFPVAYRREATMKLDAQFKWSGEGAVQDLVIRGTGPDGYDFLGSSADNKITIIGGILTLSDDAAKPFKDTIEHFDTFDIFWEFSIDEGQTWMEVATTKNQVYTLLDDPIGANHPVHGDFPLPKLFHTLAHVSSRAAQGKSTKNEVIDSIWQRFHLDLEKGLARADGTHMTYYGSWLLVTHQTTEALLRDADGMCDAWVRLFLDMLKANGIRNGDNFVSAVPNQEGEREGQGGILVKRWNFGQIQNGSGGQLGYNWLNLVLAGNDHIGPGHYNWAYAEAVDEEGYFGQGNHNPLSLFQGHFLARVQHDGGPIWYYDVALGERFHSIAEWRDYAVAGYFKMSQVAFDEAIIGKDINGDELIGIVPVHRFDIRRNLGANHINSGLTDY